MSCSGEIVDKDEQLIQIRSDISKIKQLGWEPKISLDEGLKRTLNWYKTKK